MKLIKFLSIFLFLGFVFNSCSSSESDDEPVIGGGTEITSITLSSNTTSTYVGETVTFTVTGNTGADLTAQSSIQVNGTGITGNTFAPSEGGTFAIVATYNSITSNEVSVTFTVPTVQSVTITSDYSSMFIGNSVSFTATATYDNGAEEDKTSECEFFVDGVAMTGSEYTGVAEGTVTIEAVFDSVTSNQISVQVVEMNLPAGGFSKKGVIEDYTGTWCGWCPRLSHAASLVEDATDRVITVGVHIGDVMENSFGSQLQSAFNVTGFPTAYVDRSSTWAYPEPNNVAQAVNAGEGTVDMGLEVSSTLSGSNMDITITTGFLVEMNDVKIVVFVLEDGIIEPQENYTSYYGGADVISDFEHNGVLRYSATDVLGDSTPSTVGSHEETYSVDLSSYGVEDYEKTTVLAMLVDNTGKVVLNAQFAEVNQTQNFD